MDNKTLSYPILPKWLYRYRVWKNKSYSKIKFGQWYDTYINGSGGTGIENFDPDRKDIFELACILHGDPDFVIVPHRLTDTRTDLWSLHCLKLYQSIQDFWDIFDECREMKTGLNKSGSMLDYILNCGRK